jgi:hypothetical protein
MNLENIVLREGARTQKDILYDPFYVKYSKCANPKRYEVHLSLPGFGGKKIWCEY